jgi:glycosyltransferase involved in cell wall biosynthesis
MKPPQYRLLMTTDAVGGVWQYTLDLAAGLGERGFATTLAVLGPAPEESQRREAAALCGVELLETGMPLDWLSDARSIRAASTELATLARRGRYDLVHLNSPTLAAGGLFKVPVVAAVHGCVSTWWEAAATEPLAPDYAWHRALMARGLRAADCVVAPSASYAATVRRHYDLPATPAVVHNGRSSSIPAAPTAMHDFAFTCGRLWDPVKNALTLDAVAARLAFPVHAAGHVEGPHGERVSLEHLHLLGRIDNASILHWLSSRPAFVSAATFEPFGLAVLEAASSGCPLVLSDIPTFRELWDGAATFVAPDDVKGFADAVEASVGDVGLRHERGRAAQERAARYSAERMAGAMAAIYRNLAAARVAA